MRLRKNFGLVSKVLSNPRSSRWLEEKIFSSGEKVKSSMSFVFPLGKIKAEWSEASETNSSSSKISYLSTDWIASFINLKGASFPLHWW